MIEYKPTRDPKECPHPIAGVFLITDFHRRVECRDCGQWADIPREILRKLRQTPGGVLEKPDEQDDSVLRLQAEFLRAWLNLGGPQ